MSPKKRRQWYHVYNSAKKRGASESSAHAQANGVVGRSPKKKDYIESWEIEAKKLSQQEAGYSPVGGNNERACANCNWFVPSADACVIVSGDIVPTGISDFWVDQKTYEAMPIPVYIVDEEEKSLGDKVKDFINNIVLGKQENANTAFVTFKSGDRLRFIARPTNYFRDKQKEIICEEAHREYVDWADRTGNYPELWLWHAKGTRLGQGDFLDYVDGFVVASGIIDKGKEELALSLSNDPTVGMSHGFVFQQENDTIVKYRTFEWSCLPLIHAANEWSDFRTFGDDMPFKPEKRAWLEDKLGKELVDEIEQNTKEYAERLKGLGIDWKDDDEEPVEQPPSEITLETLSQQMSGLHEAIGGVRTDVTALKIATATNSDAIKALQADDDTKIAQQFTPKANGSVQRPTESEGNVTEPTKVKQDMEWFGNVLESSVARAGGIQ